MMARDVGSAPQCGDRVPYVIVQGAKGMAAYEKSEDPVFVLDNGLQIDTEYYLHNQLSNPLTRIFEPIIENPAVLLSGDHTRTIKKAAPVARKGAITMFAVKQQKCLGCRALLPKGAGDKDALCVHCKPKAAELYLGKLSEAREYEALYSELWTECQRCAGSLHQDVLCSNADCPIFYRRKKVQKDLKEVDDLLARW